MPRCEVISCIVVNRDRALLLHACLASVSVALQRAGLEYEVIVVDNGSTDGSAALVRCHHPGARVIELADNAGFAGALTHALEVARGEWILTLNNDATIDPEAPGHLLAAARRDPRIGSVAAQMRFADRPGIINSAGIEVDRLGVAFDRLVGQPISAGCAAAAVFGASAGGALYRRAMIDDVGGLDAGYFAFLEDVDLAWRAQMAGWSAVYVPAAVVYHHHSATARHGSDFKLELVGRNRVRLLARNATPTHLRRYWPAILAYDAGYVAYVLLTQRTLAPLRGRWQGLRQWRTVRGAAPPRRSVALAAVRGFRHALARHAAWQGSPARSAGSS